MWNKLPVVREYSLKGLHLLDVLWHRPGLHFFHFLWVCKDALNCYNMTQGHIIYWKCKNANIIEVQEMGHKLLIPQALLHQATITSVSI